MPPTPPVHFDLDGFEHVADTGRSRLLRVRGRWGCPDERQLPEPTLLVHHGTRVARLTPLPMGPEQGPLAGPDPPAWSATYAVPKALFAAPGPLVYELQVVPDVFHPLPLPATEAVAPPPPDEPGGEQPGVSLATTAGAVTVGVPRANTAGALVAAGSAVIATAVTIYLLQSLNTRPELLPIVLVAISTGLILLWNSAWIFPAFAALTWTSIEQSQFGGVSPIEIGGIVLLIVALWRGMKRPALLANAMLVCAFIAIPLFATAMLSDDGFHFPTDGLKNLSFLLIVALGMQTSKDIDRLTIALCMVAIFLGLGAASSVLLGPSGIFPVEVDESGNQANRAAGPFGESNFFALSLAALLPLAIYNISRPRWRRWLGIGAAVTILAGILAAGSRGGFLTAGFAVAVFGLAAGRREVRIGALAVIAVAFLLLPVFGAQVTSSTSRSVSGRATENQIAIAQFGDHPIAGVGPDQYPVLYRDYARKIGNDPRSEREPHSLPLEIAAEQGLIGLLGWIGAIAIVVRFAWARGVWDTMLGRAMLVACATWMFGSIFLHAGLLRLLFMLVGAVLALAGAAGPLGRHDARAAPEPRA
ncbi:MAG: O-antigen ligase family protein [Solirubrobacteraceae bacterium]